jgi:hypothetical protein
MSEGAWILHDVAAKRGSQSAAKGINLRVVIAILPHKEQGKADLVTRKVLPQVKDTVLVADGYSTDQLAVDAQILRMFIEEN